MYRILSNFTWIFMAVGIFFLLTDAPRTNFVFSKNYMVALQVYLFSMCAYLVLKRVIFYRLKGNINIVSLIKKSDYQTNLMAQGIVLALLGLVYIKAYGNLQSMDTIVIILLGIYYGAQISINGNPTIYLDDNSFAYDDYFIDQWNWSEINRIVLGNERLTLVGNAKDFELDFEMVDEVDYRKLTDEVERNVLDGEFGKDKSSKSLVEIIESYAKNSGVKIS